MRMEELDRTVEENTFTCLRCYNNKVNNKLF